MELYLVPLMLFISSILMAFAWLGHIKFREKTFIQALIFSWLLVLPEYLQSAGVLELSSQVKWQQ